MLLKAVVDVIRGQPELELVGSATNGPDAAAALAQLEPEVAVLDMRLRGMSGQELLAQLTGRGSRTRVLFLSAHVERDVVYAALAGGAAGYLSKEVDGEALRDAIFAVADGETVLSAGRAARARASDRRDTHERSGLTRGSTRYWSWLRKACPRARSRLA